MRIAWFTPFSQRSSIGRCSSLVVPLLAERDEVDIWHPAADDLRPALQRTFALDANAGGLPSALSTYDAVVYNLGNYAPFHRQIFEISRRVPGICILHDFVMHHFFAAVYVDLLRSPGSYLEIMERHYGPKGRQRAAASLSRRGPRLWETDAVEEYPLFEEAIRGAYEVVVHSEFLQERVQRVYPGPVARIGLPHEVGEFTNPVSRRGLNLQDDQLLLVIVGHINPNKRAELAIEALARAAELKERALLALVGPCDESYGASLRKLAQRHGVGANLRFTGYVPDQTLHDYMRLADVCINLRHPVCEGASGSAVEEMLHGKPMVVHDVGFYRELPDNAVVKIPAQASASSLASVLVGLAQSQVKRDELSANALRFAREHFSPTLYAQEILRFIREVRYREPVLRLSDEIGVELAQFGVTEDMAILDTASRQVANLFIPERGTMSEDA
jgi:glycosyltransferase involved in cell wall biosynthesis